MTNEESTSLSTRKKPLDPESETFQFNSRYMQQLSYQLGIFISSYTIAINKEMGRVGPLFRGPVKHKSSATISNT